MILGDVSMNTSNRNNIDIRIIKLSKWQVPKKKGTFCDSNEETGYMTIGHFDVVDAKKVEDGTNHPFLRAYNSSFRHKETINEIYTIQELMVFTDIGKWFTKEVIDRFWDIGGILFFISLIHVDNEDDISKITQRIRELFKESNYIYYFSFDYSGIVIFAKDMQLSQYLEYIFQLNYNNDGRKIIRDSYSIYGLNKNKLKNYFACIKDNGYGAFRRMLNQEYQQLGDEKFAVSVNVGISEFETYKNFISELKSNEIAYRLFGRHDVSIVNNDANLAWIIYVHYLLNYDENEPYFSTYETFVKIPMSQEMEYRDGKKDVCNFLHLACSDLNALKDIFCVALKKKSVYDGQYKLPLCAVINSIYSISGNRFAEDFVLCMYKSFRDFILYLTNKLSGDDESEEIEFDQCYSEYFKGLNSLVNSTMHSERQFIQATAFNAIIYDIPSKIMAFYVAMINKLQNIIHTENDKRYTFFLTPSFSNQISVNIFSYEKEKLPHDRLLMVTINEASLFNPHAVMRRMAHEIAHFEGDDLRRRSDRKRRIKLTLVYTALSKILYRTFLEDESFIDLGKEICDLLNDNIRLNDDKYNYSKELLLIGEYIYLEFLGNKSIEELLEKNIEYVIRKQLQNKKLVAYLEKLENNYLSNGSVDLSKFPEKISNAKLKLLTNLVMKDVRTAVEYLNTEAEIAILHGEIDNSVVTKVNGQTGILGECTDDLVSAYSEAFADIHMVLLTGISYSEYIRGFVEEENFDVDNLPKRRKDHARISVVSVIMYVIGVWEEVLGRKLELSPKLTELHNMIREKAYKMCCEIKEMDEKDKDIIRDMHKKAFILLHESQHVEYICINLNNLPDNVEKTDRYNFSSLPFLDMGLFAYLLNCTRMALETYIERSTEIVEVRNVLKEIVEFKSVEKVFSVMCNEINKYKMILKREIEEKRDFRNT